MEVVEAWLSQLPPGEQIPDKLWNGMLPYVLYEVNIYIQRLVSHSDVHNKLCCTAFTEKSLLYKFNIR